VQSLFDNTSSSSDYITSGKNYRKHPTAIVANGAKIGSMVDIGPYSIIGDNVTIGDGSTIGPHVFIDGWTTIGKNNQISTGAIIGNAPQDLKFQGEKSYVLIGNNNIIREYVTINRGTANGGGVTRIGDHNLLMTSAHVAHDAQIGDHNVISQAAAIGGHVIIEDWVTVGYSCGIHQFTRLGRLSMIGALSMISKDVAPYGLVTGNPPKTYGTNVERLRRNGFSASARQELYQSYKILFNSGLTLKNAIEQIATRFPNSENINYLLAFLRYPGRGIYR